MITRLSLITLSAIVVLVLCCPSANAQDYSAYNIAKTHLGERNYLLAYKFMLIFKYSNLDRLQKKENAAALNSIDNQISVLEDYLSSNVSWYVIKQSKGWTDQQIQDSSQNQARAIRLKKITIQ